MASKEIKSVLDDPRYIEFVAKYRYNWERFSVELVGKNPTPQQQLIISETQQIGARVAVSSGHGTGKSDMTATMMLVFILCFPNSRAVLTANNAGQAKNGVWKYLKVNFAAVVKSEPWLAQYFVLTETKFYAKEGKGVWECLTKSCRIGQEEALAGEHCDHLLVIVDEASGVSDKAMGVLGGSLTQDDNRMLLLSQPTRPSGYFYDAHHKNAKPRGAFTAITLNSELSPLVNVKFIMDKRIEYGGRESTEYLIKVRGEFPSTIDGMLLGRDPLDKAARLNLVMPDGWGWMATIDVGNGRDKSIINICKVWGKARQRIVKNIRILEMPSTIDPVRFADVINAECSTSRYPNISLVVDGDGIGSATIAALAKLGRKSQSIRWGKKPHSKEEKAQFLNLRAKAHVFARDAVMGGRMQIDTDIKTAEQGSKLPCALDDMGRWVMMSKQLMKRKLNISSPDRFDTYCFTQIANYVAIEDIVPAEEQQARTEVEGWVLGDMDDLVGELV